jgi:hypothetical protein
MGDRVWEQVLPLKKLLELYLAICLYVTLIKSKVFNIGKVVHSFATTR